MARLGDVCALVNGYAFKPSDWSDSGLPIIRIQNLNDESASFNYFSGDIDEKYIVHTGDLLFAWSGTPGTSFGAFFWKREKGVLNQHIFNVYPNEGLLLKEYFRYALNGNLEKIIAKAHGGVGLQHITKKELVEIDIPIPSMDRQRDICHSLGQLELLIFLRKQQIAKLDELVKARFVEMFGDIVETVPLSYYIAALTAGKSLAGEEVCSNKVLKTGAATYDYFDPTQVKDLPVDYEPQEEHRVKTGDVIISRMNTAELVGAAAYVWEAPESTYLPDRLWRAEIKDTACPIFVWQVLIQSSTKDSIRSIASGTSGSMKNISKPGLLSIHVKKIPLDLQRQFAAFVAQTDQQKSTIQQSLAQLELLKKALMQKYFG